MRKKRFTPGRAIRILARTFLIIIGIGLLLMLLVQMPFVQNIMRKEAVTFLEKKLNTNVEIGRVSIVLPNRIALDDVYVEDKNKDTLLSGGTIRVNMNLLKLFFKKEVDINSIKLENIVARVKRQLPDTLYNFQFILDSFTSSNAKRADTNTVSYAIPSIELDNIRFQLKDTILGIDMAGSLEHLDTRLDEFDPGKKIFGIPLANIHGLTAYIYQSKPLVEPESDSVDRAEAVRRNPMVLDIGETSLKNIKIDFRNNVSAFYTTLDIGEFKANVNEIDLFNRVIDLEEFSLVNSTASVRLGEKPEAKIVEREVEKELESHAEAGWRISANKINIDSSNLSFDNDNHARENYGMDYAHLKAEAVTILIEDFLLARDSIGGKITNARFREQSGFELLELNADALYANTVLYLRNLYLKTPGTELRRHAEMHYASYNDLAQNFQDTRMDIDIDDSHVKVSDILTFAPSLRRQTAFSNPNDTWYLDVQANGTTGALNINNLSFAGLKDTRVEANGVVALNKNSNNNGTLYIRRLHTNQSDIAMFTGSRLSNANLNLPETFDASGTIRGSLREMNTDLGISSNAGAIHVKGRFTNLDNPKQLAYNAI
jgi:translocation and assembly module TamB